MFVSSNSSVVIGKVGGRADVDGAVGGAHGKAGLDAHIGLDRSLRLFLQLEAFSGLEVALLLFDPLRLHENDFLDLPLPTVRARLVLSAQDILDMRYLALYVTQQGLADHE